MFSSSWENQSFLQVSLLRKKRRRKKRLWTLQAARAIASFCPTQIKIWPFVVVQVLLYIHRNRRLIRDGSPGRPPRLSHSSWALSCNVVVVQVLLYVHRNRRLIRDGSPGRPTRLSHSSWALSCNVVVVQVLLYVHRNRRLIRDGSPGRPTRLSHSSWALAFGHFDRLGDPRRGLACYMTVRMTSGASRSRKFLSEALNFPSTSLSGYWASDETTWETSVWKLVGSIRLRFRDVTCCFALLGFLRESSQNTVLWSDSAMHIMSRLWMAGKSSWTIITQSTGCYKQQSLSNDLNLQTSLCHARSRNEN